MQFVPVNYSINKMFYVEKIVFEQLIKQTFSKTKEITLENVEVVIDKNGPLIKLDLLIDPDVNFSKKLIEVQNTIEFIVNSLTNSNTENIQFNIKKR